MFTCALFKVNCLLLSSFMQKANKIIGLFLLFFAFNSYAVLTAVTVKTIKGSAPAFSSDVNMNDFPFFAIKYNDKSHAQASALWESVYEQNPDIIIGELTPSALYNSDLPNMTPVITQNITQTEFMDVDGDGIRESLPSIVELTSGSVSLNWYNINKTPAEPLTTEQMNTSLCALSVNGITPSLVVSGGIKLYSEYGDPNVQAYPDAELNLSTPSKSFVFSWPIPEVCSAYPLSDVIQSDIPAYNSQWQDGLGFFKQSDTDASKNFPTVGADGLYFDLFVIGVDPSKVEWQVQPSSNASGVTVSTDKQSTGYPRVTLTGPVNTNKGSTVINNASKFTSGTTFAVNGYIDGSSTPSLSYKFKLDKWFIYYYYSRIANSGVNKNDANKFCNTDNYRMANLDDASNANKLNNYTLQNTGTLYPSGTNAAKRVIGGGLIAEWGDIKSFAGGTSFWTNSLDNNSNSTYLGVGMNNGGTTSSGTGSTKWGSLCVNR